MAPGERRFGLPVFRTRSPRSRSFLALAAAFFGAALFVPRPAPGQPAIEARQRLAEGRSFEVLDSLVATLEAEPESAEGQQLLWTLARGATPGPALMSALVARAGRLGPDGWLAAGVLLRRGLRPLDALEAFDRGASARPPGDSLADIEAGRLLAELRSDELAQARFGRHPEDPAAMYGRAVILARTKRTGEATALTDALLRADPDNPAALLLRAELLDSVGRGSETLGMLRRLAAETGPTGPAASRLARILVKLGQSEEALPHLEAILAATPQNAEAWLALARTHQDAGRREEAAEAFRRALAADDALNTARFGLAQLLVRTGGREEANRLFAEFERRKAMDDAAARLLGAAELRPDDFTAVAAFVNHALANGDVVLALRAAQRFLIEFPEDPQRHLLVARVFREGGSRADAERVLRRGLERFAGDEEAERRFEAGLRAIGVR